MCLHAGHVHLIDLLGGNHEKFPALLVISLIPLTTKEIIMFIGILGAVTAMSAALDWADDTSTALREEEDRKTKYLLRGMAGARATLPGGVEEEINIPDFVEVPADPALGGRPVLMTHREAIWWMSASQDEQMSRHVGKIRKILRAQASRRAAFR